MSNIKPIRTEADHKAALVELDKLWHAKRGTPAGDRFEVLSILVDAYERENFPIDPPGPIEAILFRLDQEGLDRKALEPVIGRSGRVSEILSGKRQLTLAMIRRLNVRFGIPLDVLLQPTPPQKKAATDGRVGDKSRIG